MAGFPQLVDALLSDCTAVPLAADVVCHDHAQGLTFTGPTSTLQLLQAYFGGGFSRTRLVIHTLISSGEAGALEFTLQGWHDAPFLGLPPTGMEIGLPMAMICHMEAGEVKRVALYYDAGMLLQQMGLGV